MRARYSSSVSRAALAVLIGLAAQAWGPARAQFDGGMNDYLSVRENAPICINSRLPPAKRIASCTSIINLAEQGSYMARRQIGSIYVARATALQQDGDDQAALNDFHTAMQKDPKNELPWLGLGNFYMSKSAYSKALENYEHAVKLASKDAVAFDDRGAAFAALRRNDEAIADFTQALALDRHDTTALSNRATLYLASNRAELAIADLTEVIRAEPTKAMAFYNRGTAYERSNAVDKAVEDYRGAVRLNPSFGPAYEALGRVLAKQNPEMALSELSEAVRLDPRSPALRSRGILYLSLGRFDDAIRDFDQVIATDDLDNIAYLDRGVAEQNLGNLQKARDDYSRSINIDTTVAALVDRGSVYERLGQSYQALGDFYAALALDPNNVAALIGRADANYAPGTHDAQQLAASLEDFTHVIEAAPKNAAAYLVRGNIHFDLKQYAAAYSDYSTSIELDANQPAALFNRSLAAEHLGRSAEAARDRHLASQLDASMSLGAGSSKPQKAAAATQLEYAKPSIRNDAPGVAFAEPRTAPGSTAQSASAEAPLQEVTINGYRRVVVNGETRFCRTQQTTGSHVEKATVCLTQRELDNEREKSRLFIQQIQRSSGVGVQMPMEMSGAPR